MMERLAVCSLEGAGSRRGGFGNPPVRESGVVGAGLAKERELRQEIFA
ncbi:hypothetical protein [Scytonema millei]|uniref:Uncharacterized protein n=1 Tax=Scytonema millei VB511283 TaxID=1245923 RepID=A0A9X5E2U7_9CYAN|nr:hypothetical protein [Scytonema millei]NHC34165.1 hypothetical protein [Scytonema millei VB511283]